MVARTSLLSSLGNHKLAESLILAYCILVSFTGCRTNFVQNDEAVAPTSTPEETPGYAYGTDVAKDVTNSTTTPMGTLIVAVSDHNRLHPEGMPVEVAGDLMTSAITDADGNARFDLSPGIYTFRIPSGCHDDVLIEVGGGGSVQITADAETKGSVDVRWKHRYGPGPATYPSKYPYWGIGDEIAVDFEVIDRCNSRRVPIRSIRTFGFDLSPNLMLSREPALVANGNGYATVYVTCKSSGGVSIVAFDRANKSDRLDLMEYALFPGSYPGEPFECRSSDH